MNKQNFTQLLQAGFEEFWDLLLRTDDYLQGQEYSGYEPGPDTTSLVEAIAAQAQARALRKVALKDPLESAKTLEAIAQLISNCKKCRLHEERTHTVPGTGHRNPKVMIIGEAPGAQEDATGIPFVGKAGNYLDAWMDAIQLDRDKDIFIGNIIKCRPPGNRDPLPDEKHMCINYLNKQIELVNPKTILCVGRISAQIISGIDAGIGKLRGRVYHYKNIPVVVTYHPSAVLRSPEQYRRPVWEDLKILMKLLETL